MASHTFAQGTDFHPFTTLWRVIIALTFAQNGKQGENKSAAKANGAAMAEAASGQSQS